MARWLGADEASRFARVEAAGGSGFARTAFVTDADGRTAFVKWGASAETFRAEALGLERLAGCGRLRLPGRAQATRRPPALIMEAVVTGRRSDRFERLLGRGLAELHRSSGAERFGFEQATFLGATRQSNDWDASWSSFFLEQRLRPQLLGVRGLSSRLDALTEPLARRAEELLDGLDPEPRLVHGDLWSGNVLSDEDGRPVLIDPAVFYGHHEYELGMTSLFGGFGPAFYDAYHEVLVADSGTRDRVALYRLIHLLNHVSLFGSSYLSQTLDLARRLC